jgi:hypothetical protein
MDVHVELLADPFCMADRDNETVGNTCKGLGVSYRLLNMWDIDDDMEGIPGTLIHVGGGGARAALEGPATRLTLRTGVRNAEWSACPNRTPRKSRVEKPA